MGKYLRPECFHAVPNITGLDKAWLQWKRAFINFSDYLYKHCEC